MKHVIVEHAAPASRGVTQIMGLAGDEYDEEHAALVRRVGIVSVGMAVAGFVLGSDFLKNVGLGGAVASYVIGKQ